MTDVLISVLNMSVAASIVAAAVMTARLLLTKAPKIFSYALWAVVFLRLVCPVNFESPASFMPVNSEIIPHSVVYEPMPRIESGISAVDEPLNRIIENTFPEANRAASENPVQIALTAAAYVWFFGAAALLIYGAAGYIRLKRRVYDATVDNGNVFRTDKVATAFVLGLARPKIYIPLNVGGARLEHITRHERVHIRRFDYLIKPLAFVILAVHWFNPLVWISYYLMSKDMEMSCDEAVLRGSKDDLRKDYSKSLVNLYTRKPALLSPLAFGEGSYNNMKARIKNVLNFKKAPRWAVMICSFALLIFAVGFTTNPPKKLSAEAIIDSVAENISASEREPLDNLGIKAHARSGQWAAGTGIEGDTWQSQMEDEIKWLEDIYAENENDFVITETLAASEAADVSRINYLYENSDVFRGMSGMDDGGFAVEDGQEYTGFSMTKDFVHRTAVMVDGSGALTLDIDYSLQQGKLAVWLVDPDGFIAYQGNANTVYKGSRTVTGKKGLWSVIRVYEGGEESVVNGNIAISLRQADDISEVKGLDSGLDSFTGREPQIYFQIIGKDGSKNIASSGSFIAGTGQRLTVTSKSSIIGGTVDLFLFSPSGEEQRFTFGSANKTETVELTAGTWAYNCSGIYKSGSIVITGTNPQKTPDQALADNLGRYVPYGAVYDVKQEALFYNGERVKLLVEFKSGGEDGTDSAFDLCYRDANTDSDVYLEAVKDSAGNITGIQKLDNETALEILDGIDFALQNKSEASKMSVTMDATAELTGTGITATDKSVTKENVPQYVKNWIAQCDETQGAFTLTEKSVEHYITYVYYNGGGRYPWNLTAGGDSVSLRWVSNGSLSTEDGYCLMYFTSPKEYENIKLYCDDRLLDII